MPAFVVASCTGLLLAPVSWTHHQTPVVLAALCVGTAGRRRTAVLRGAVVLMMTVNLASIPIGAIPPGLAPLAPLIAGLCEESRFLLIAYLVLLARFETPTVRDAHPVSPTADRASGLPSTPPGRPVEAM